MGLGILDTGEGDQKKFWIVLGRASRDAGWIEPRELLISWIEKNTTL